MSDLVHELLVIYAERQTTLVLPSGHRIDHEPRPGDEEFKEREARRVWDELGTLVGIGPMPAGPHAPA